MVLENGGVAVPQMTAEELAEYKAWQADKLAKEEKKRRKAQRAEYAKMVDEELALAIPQIMQMSEEIATLKDAIFGNFETVLDMKAEIFDVKLEGQYSNTFTSSDGQYRLILGAHTIDSYRDTINEGVAKVMAYIESLAIDDNTGKLVSAVTRLLKRNAAGAIPSRQLIELRKLADEWGADEFADAVTIIEESYQPMTSKAFIKAFRRGVDGAWVAIPTSFTEALGGAARAAKEQEPEE